MKIFRRTALLILLLSTASGFAETGSMPIPLGSLGMGGAYLAVHDSPLAIAHNPAMLGLPIRHPFQIATTAMLNGDGFRLLGSIGSDIKKHAPGGITAAPDDLLAALQSFGARYRMGVDLAYRGEGFGILIFGNGQGRVNFSGATLPTGDLRLDQDTSVVIGLGVPITVSKRSDTVFLTGINLRYVNRIRFQKTGVSFEEAGSIVDPFDLDTDILMGQAIGSDISATLIAGPTTFTVAWRNWFGLRFTWVRYDSDWNSLDEDLGDTLVKPSLDFGMVVRFRSLFGISREVVSGTVFALDVRGFLREEDSFFNMLHFGMQTTLLEFLTLKFGFSRGWPTVGVGSTIRDTISLEYAVHTEEEGTMPGQNPFTYHAFSLTLLF